MLLLQTHNFINICSENIKNACFTPHSMSNDSPDTLITILSSLGALILTGSAIYLLHTRKEAMPVPPASKETCSELERRLHGLIGQYRIGLLPREALLERYARIRNELKSQCILLPSYLTLHAKIKEHNLGEIIAMKAKLLHRKEEYAHDVGISVHYLFSNGPPTYVGIVAENLEEKAQQWDVYQFNDFMRCFWPSDHHA